MSIYKPCDIRGHHPSDLTPDLYRNWGRTLGRRVGPGAKFVVGGDVRLSTPSLSRALVEGLCRSGVDVVDLGTLPTPMIYYAKHRLAAAGCAVVTASHNPPDQNGLKWMLGDHPPTPEEVGMLQSDAPASPPDSSHEPPGSSRTLDVSFDYVAWLQETWADSPAAGCQVVLDPMYGCWAGHARRYLQAVFPQVVFSAIHDTPDPVFDGRSPDCSRPEQLEELCLAVDRQRAQLGIAFDGDGDRVAFVDDYGTPLSAEEATWVMLQSFGPGLDGEAFVHDLKFSDRIGEAAEQLGAKPIAERSGHSFIRRRMLETGAAFGAEISGHYYFRALAGGDDGLFSACWLIDYLTRNRKTLTELRRTSPEVFLTPDFRIPVEPDDGTALLEVVRRQWSQYPQSSLDGVRVNFPDGWALVRSSVTEPVLTFRFEGVDAGRLDELVERFCDSLGGIGDQLMNRYEESMAR